MSEFKVGDRAVVNGYNNFGVKDGYKGTVKQVGMDACSIHFDETINGWGDEELEIPCNQGLYIRFEYLTLIEKKERGMKLYTSELMELARKEPEKYEGKRYKVVDGSLFYATGTLKSFKECVIRNGEIISTGNPYSLAVQSDSKVEEIKPQPVPFMEAVKAYSEGKAIRCEVVPSTTNQVYEYEPNGNGIELHGYKLATYKGSGTPVTTKEILEGEWFIKE